MTCNLRHPVGLCHPVLNISCRSFSAKEPLSIELFCGKWPVKIRHPMDLCLMPLPPCRESVRNLLEIYSYNLQNEGTESILLHFIRIFLTCVYKYVNEYEVHTYIYTDEHTYTHVYVYICTCLHVHIHVCIYICINHIHACIHTYINVYTLIHTYILMHTRFRICMHSYADTHIRIDM